MAQARDGSQVNIRLNKAHFPVTTLGYGRRLGLWVQGCSIGCKGCVSRDTWDAAGGWDVDIAEVVDWCDARRAEDIDGITISGGEPFEQPQALTGLLGAVHAWRQRFDRPFDILCYSGLPLRKIERHHADILALLDALIPEPYIDHRPDADAAAHPRWRGSSNQPLLPLTPLGRLRYEGLAQDAGDTRRIQVSVEHGAVWLIGIPEHGDMDRMEQQARARGVELRGVSWRA